MSDTIKKSGCKGCHFLKKVDKKTGFYNDAMKLGVDRDPDIVIREWIEHTCSAAPGIPVVIPKDRIACLSKTLKEVKDRCIYFFNKSEYRTGCDNYISIASCPGVFCPFCGREIFYP